MMKKFFVFEKAVHRFCALSLCVLGSISMISSLKASEVSAFDFLNPMLEKKKQVALVVRPHIKGLAKHRHSDEVTVNSEDPIEVSCQKLMASFFKDGFWTPKKYKIKQDFKGLFDLYTYKESSSQDILLANIYYYVAQKISPEREENRRQVLEYAAALGHDEAQYQMHKESFRKGRYDEARTYLMSAAAQGNSDAFDRLSDVYSGISVLCKEKDLELAKAFCKEAADLGHKGAAFAIKVASFTEGMFGTDKNFQKGVTNALALAENGNPEAKEFIDSIKGSSADSLCESFDYITKEDAEFLKEKLGWVEQQEWSSDEEND